MKKAIARTCIAIALVVIGCAFARPDEPTMARREFGFSLNPNTQGELFTLFLYTVLEGEVVDSRPMRTESFILQMAGVEESAANIESIDLFEEYGIVGCGPMLQGTEVLPGLDCPSIQNLWKLRYRGSAVEGGGLGWAGEEFRPTDRQQILLQAYRLPHHQHWHGPYIGKDAFRLLRDMQDAAWVRTYRDGG